MESGSVSNGEAWCLIDNSIISAGQCWCLMKKGTILNWMKKAR